MPDAENSVRKRRPRKCPTCKAWLSGAKHNCPFAEDVHDAQRPCFCCPSCTRTCALDA